MRLLYCRLFGAYNDKIILDKYKKMGVDVDFRTYFTPEDFYNDSKLYNMLEHDIKTYKYDLVFTVNFWPIVAQVCNELRVRYISWTYDSPMNLATTQDMDYDTNYIFVFDRDAGIELAKEGIENIYHLPLASDVDYFSGSSKPKFKYDVSLLGNLYESTLTSLLPALSDYNKGYINAIVESQRKIYGYYMIPELLTDDIVDSIVSELAAAGAEEDFISKKKLAYSICTYVAFLDRMTLLSASAKRYKTALVTGEIPKAYEELLKDVVRLPYASYDNEMPAFFRSSKVNLNPQLRSIRSGVSLRALDIMASGGFALNSFQPELAEYFTDGVDVAMYESIEDGIAKIDFYLKNDDIRESIRQASIERIKADFTYESRIQSMFETAGIELC